MPELFTDGAIAEDQGHLTDFSSSAAENFGAGFQRGWDTNPVAFIGRGIRSFTEDWEARFGDGELVDQETAQAEVKRRGLDIDIPVGGISRWELDTLQYLKQREIGQMTVSARPQSFGATMAGVAGSFAAGAVDPINIASAFIPVVREARYSAWLARAGESALARAAVRAKVGAIEGVVGAALVEPIVYFGAQREQLEYGLVDSFVNVMFGGALGGGLHVLGGAAYDWRIRRALTQLDIGLRALYANVPDTSHLAALQQAAQALETDGPVRSNEVLAAGLKPGQVEALAALPGATKVNGVPVTREVAEVPGLAIEVRPVREATAVTPAGRRVPVLYAIADLDKLTTSHTGNLDENPAFPQALQPRDRTRAQSEAQIANMAAKLNPELLGEQPQAGAGAPIVDKTGIVESGNGRVIALRRVQEGNPAKWREYTDWLKAQGYDTEGIAKPVLVRVRTNELDAGERAAFTREANAPEVAGLSASEQAIADARALPGDVLALHKGGDFRNVGNASFVQAVINAIAPSQAERSPMLRPDGSLSDEGARRIERAILARAFGDDASLITALTEASEESGIKAIGGALVDVAPLWARMRAEAAANTIDPSVDSTANLLEAVRTIREARGGGKNLFDVVHQVDILSGQMDPRTQTWVRAMFRNANLTGPLGRDKLAELFTFYADEARKQTPGPNLLGEAGATPEQILLAKREQDRRRGKQLDLLGGGPGRAAPVLEPDAKAPGDVSEPRPGEVGEPVGRDRGRDEGELDLSKYRHPVTGKTLEEMTAEALARPSTHTIDTPERMALREQVAEQLYGEGAPVKERDVTLVYGPPAAGKSAISDPIVERMGALLVDADEAKKLLPEFDNGIGSNSVHDESSAIMNAILATAMEQGDNIVLPGTGKTLSSQRELIEQFKAHGYRVRVVLMDVPIKTAAKRAAERFAKNGRLVNIPFVLSVGDKPAKTYEALKESGLVDEFVRFDNDVPQGTPPRLVEAQPDARDADSAGRLERISEAVSGFFGGSERARYGAAGPAPVEGPASPGEGGAGRGLNQDRWAAEDAEIAARADAELASAKDRDVTDIEADTALFDAHLTSMRERGLLDGKDEAALLDAEEIAVDLEHRAAAYEAAAACEMEG